MDRQRIILESSSGFVLICILAGLGYAFLLYRTKHPWSKTLNGVLFGLRAVLAFFLSFLLLSPIVRQINNLLEKPFFVVLQDDSGSIKEAVDSVTLENINREVSSLNESLRNSGYEAHINNLKGDEVDVVEYSEVSTDIHSALRNIANRYEGRKIDGVLLVSDGIYNTGLSPLYSTYNFPVHTLGVGDTTQRVDILIRNVAYNKIAYQGNRFPIRVEVLLKGLTGKEVGITLLHRGNVIDRQTKKSSNDPLIVYDFQPLANEQGIQKYDIQVDVREEEFNKRNNRTSVFVEVVEGKKKILVVAASPHPDIKSLRAVVDKNTNYEFLLHIPGISELNAGDLVPEKTDLVILHQVPDVRGRTRDIFQRFATSKTSMLLVLGRQSDLSFIARQNMPLKFESIPRDYDDVTPTVNAAFNHFTLEAETNSRIADFPPVAVPFGKTQLPLNVKPLLFQRVGSIVTDKPLLAVDERPDKKIAILLGEGIWRWRLDEFEQTENARGFDELFGKLIQYLSTTDDRRRFRSYPIQQEFSDVEPVTFESQVYNDIFEPIYGHTIDINLTDDAGKVTRYSYVTSPGNNRYQIGGLHEGVYRYRSSTTINGQREDVQGQFAVVEKLTELQNLTADFDLLRKLSANTGGRFYTLSGAASLKDDLTVKQAINIIRTEETYDSVINIKWIFWLLLLMAGCEWFLRKYFGSY